MHIALVCHYFLPEVSAPSLRVSELARLWTEKGHEVTVLTGFPNHPTGIVPPSYRGQRFMIEHRDGYRILRSFVYPTPNEGFLKKTISHLSFAVSAVLQSAARVGRPDVVIASTPTLFSAMSGWWIARRANAPLVLDIRDLWPAAIEALGIVRHRWALGLLERLESFLYSESAHLVVVTESFQQTLIHRGIPAGKLTVIPNGVTLERFIRAPEAIAKLRADLGIGRAKVAAYIGTHGLSHSLDTILDAAKDLLDDPTDIRILLVGDGADRARLQARAATEGLRNVQFLPAQPPDRIADYYALADLLLVSLRDVPLFRGFIPSKLFECMAAERPIVAGLAGESADIVLRSQAGLVVRPEDPKDMANAVRVLLHDPELRRVMGQRGRVFVEHHYTRGALADRYLQLLQAIVRGGV